MRQIVSLRVDGQLVELSNEASIRTAIKRGHLTRSTRVRIERDGREEFVGPAVEDAVLSPLLDELDPLPATPEPPQPERPDPTDESPINTIVLKTARTKTPSATDNKVAQDEKPVAKDALAEPVVTSTLTEFGASGRKGQHPLVWVVVAIVVLALGRCVFGGGGRGSPTTSPVAPEPAVADAASAASAPAAVAETFQGYAIREVDLTDRPSDSGARVGKLARGTFVYGEWVDVAGGRWLRLAGGSNDGAFIWSGSISAVSPPTLVASGGTLEVVRPMSVYADPNYSSQVVGDLRRGQRLEPIGQTIAGWVEIPWGGQGVGYVRLEALTEPVLDSDTDDGTVAAGGSGAPNCREVRSQVGQTTEVQTLCQDERGNWVPRGNAVRVPIEPSEAGGQKTATPVSPTAPTTIQRAEWLQEPDLSRYHPERALAAKQGGRVGLDCEIDQAGRARDCRVRSESNPGWGFAAAALRATAELRMAEYDLDARLTAGRRIRFSITFHTPEDAP